MSSLSTQPEYPAEESIDDARLNIDPNLDQLRWLLLAPEQQQIQALRYRLDDPRQKSHELSQCIAEALAIRAQRDRKLQAILQPLIQDAIRVAAARDPQSLAVTLAPVLIPALLKAAKNSLRSQLAALNNSLGRVLLLEGLRWRLLAARSGDPVNAVALTNSHSYRVEHAYLIHRDSGLVLGHAGIDLEPDFELISAIEALGREPAGDAFHPAATNKPKALEVMRIGNRRLWLRHGPLATLAVAVAGYPPHALGQQLEIESEIVHEVFSTALRSFNGDPETVSGIAKHLRGCLMLGRRKPGARNSYKALWTMTAILAAAIALYLKLR